MINAKKSVGMWNCGKGGITPSTIIFEPITYEQAQVRMLAKTLVPNVMYGLYNRPNQISGNNPESYIRPNQISRNNPESVDLGIALLAVSSSLLAIEGTRLMLCPKHYDTDTYNSINWLGIWQDSLSPATDDVVIWGGMVFKNLTGSVGTKLSRTELDTTNWVKILKTDLDYYEELEMSCSYDFANDWVFEQRDKNGNVFGRAFGFQYEIGMKSNPIDHSDWNLPNLIENKAFGVFNVISEGGIGANTTVLLIQDVIISTDNGFGSNSAESMEIVRAERFYKNTIVDNILNVTALDINLNDCITIEDIVSSGNIRDNNDCIIRNANIDGDISYNLKSVISNITTSKGINNQTTNTIEQLVSFNIDSLVVGTPLLINTLVGVSKVITKITAIGSGLNGTTLKIGTDEVGDEGLISALTTAVNSGVAFAPISTFSTPTTTDSRHLRFEAIGTDITTGTVRVIVEFL